MLSVFSSLVPRGHEDSVRVEMILLIEKTGKVETGGVDEIIKRSQSVTHRLLSVNTEEDQTSLRPEMPHDNSLSNTLYRDRCG